MSRSESDGAQRGGLAFYSETIKLVTGLAWPLFAIGVLLAYKEPVGQAIAATAKKFEAANKVAIGGLQLEIEEQARNAGNPELARRLAGLTPDAVRELLEVGRSKTILVGRPAEGSPIEYSIPGPSKMLVVRELEAKGLVRFAEDIDQFLKWIRSDLFEPHERPDDDRFAFRPKRALTQSEMERLTRQSYSLTDLGKAAWETVIVAVNEELRAR